MMSHRFAHRIVLTALCLASVGVLAQDGVVTKDPSRGAALFAQARAAVGGDEKLKSVHSLQTKGSFRRMAGTNALEGDVELAVQWPDKMRRIEDRSIPGGPSVTVTQGLNGSVFWDDNTGGAGAGRGFGGGFGGPGGGRGGFGGFDGGDRGFAASDAPQGRVGFDPERRRQLQLAQRQADLARLTLAWLLTTDAPVAWIGTAESPDGRADVLEVTPPEGTPTRLFLDVSTHLPLMLTWSGQGPRAVAGRGRPADDQTGASGRGQRGGVPPPVTFRMTLGDYRQVSGILLPHAIARGVNGQTTEEWTIKSYRVNPTFNARVFAK